MLVITGMFTALYVSANADAEAVAERLTERRTTLAEVDRQVAVAMAEREAAERHNKGLEEENAALADCVEAAQSWLWDDLTSAQRATALNRMFAVCR